MATRVLPTQMTWVRLATPAMFILLLSLVSCRQETRHAQPEPPRTAAETVKRASSDGSAHIEIRIPGVSLRDATHARVPGFQVNAAALQLWIDAPDVPLYALRLPVTAHDHQVSVPAGPARTLRLEVENQWGLVIYHSPPQTLDLVAGEHRVMSFPLEWIETILPIAAATTVSTKGEATLVVREDDSPLQELRLVIPAQNLGQPFLVTIDEVYNAADIPTPEKQAGVMIDIQPHGVSLAQPAELTFPYYQTLMSRLSLPESHLRLSRYIVSEQQWQPVAQQMVHSDENTVTAQLSQFGVFALIAGDQPATTSPVNRVETQPEETVQKTVNVSPEATTAVDTEPVVVAETKARSAVDSAPVKVDKHVATSVLPHVEPVAWENERVHLTLRPYQHGTVGIILRYQDAQTHYRFVWHLHQQQANLIKHDQGQVTVLASKSLPYAANRAYQIETTTIGNAIKVATDGQIVFDIRDDDIPSGSTALHCTSGSDVCFEHVRIETLTTSRSQPKPAHGNKFLR